AELDLLSRFSTQAAIGLDLLLRARRARSALGDDEGGSAALVARVAALLDETDEEAGRRLLEALETLLREKRTRARPPAVPTPEPPQPLRRLSGLRRSQPTSTLPSSSMRPTSTLP